MAWIHLKKNPTPAPSLEELRELALRLEKLLHGLGYTQVRAFRTPDMPIFSAADEKRRRLYGEILRPYVEAIEETIAAGEDPRETRRLLWRTLSKLRLVPRSDLMNKIDDQDIVEYYDRKNRQIFRNLTFFRLVNASIEEVVGADWSKVTKRDLRLTFRMFAQVATVISGRLRETIDLHADWPEHRMTMLPTGQVFMMQFRYLSPISRDGRPAGFIIIHRTRPV